MKPLKQGAHSLQMGWDLGCINRLGQVLDRPAREVSPALERLGVGVLVGETHAHWMVCLGQLLPQVQPRARGSRTQVHDLVRARLLHCLSDQWHEILVSRPSSGDILEIVGLDAPESIRIP